MKSTHGWDDEQGRTVLQRDKEDAQDYRYFPDPDLPPVEVDDAWIDRARARVGETPMAKLARFESMGLTLKDATAIVEERSVCTFFEETMHAINHDDRARVASNLVLQVGMRLANEREVLVSDLGISSSDAGAIGTMRARDEIAASGAERLFELMCGREGDVRAIAEAEGLFIVRDEGALDAWCDEVIASNPPIVEQIRSGKTQAIGRLIGEVMKKSGGQADPKSVRERLLEKIGT
ncbi:MAG: hypothetical protein KDA28_10730 [Phycisphaerales bacterium]|nr:hypothetical protein [Phycisphaerales bacterium]